MKSSWFDQLSEGSRKVDRLRTSTVTDLNVKMNAAPAGPGTAAMAVSSKWTVKPEGGSESGAALNGPVPGTGAAATATGTPASAPGGAVEANFIGNAGAVNEMVGSVMGRAMNLPDTPFLGQYKGMAADGYCLWFLLVDLAVQELYELLMTSLTKEVRQGTIRPVSDEDVQEDKPILAITKDGVLIRGAIIAVNKDADGKVKGRVTICDLDTVSDMKISTKNLYQWTSRAYTVPFLAMKVELAGMQLLAETELVAHAMEHCSVLEKTLFKAVKSKQKPAYNGSYCLDLYDLHGRNLSSRLLRALEHVCCPPLPPFADHCGNPNGAGMSVTITHYLEDGFVFYQCLEGRNELKLLDFVENFDFFIRRNLQLIKDTLPGYSDVEAVKSRLEAPKHVFAAPYKADDKYYRAELCEIVDQDQVRVRFIDYGNDELVSLSEIVLMDAFDEVLAYLPAQARCIKLRDVAKLDERMEMVLDHYSDFRIQLVDSGSEYAVPVADLLVKAEGLEDFIPLQEAIATA